MPSVTVCARAAEILCTQLCLIPSPAVRSWLAKSRFQRMRRAAAVIQRGWRRWTVSMGGRTALKGALRESNNSGKYKPSAPENPSPAGEKMSLPKPNPAVVGHWNEAVFCFCFILQKKFIPYLHGNQGVLSFQISFLDSVLHS